MKRTSILLLVCFVFTLKLIAQGTPNQDLLSGSTVKQNSFNNSLVPPNFNPEKQILLVMHFPKRHHREKTNQRVTKVLQKAMDKYYSPYRYVIVTPKELKEETKYADTTVYRYVLENTFTSFDRVDGGYTKNLTTGVRTPNQPLQVAHTVIAFRMHDRSTGINCRYTPSASFIGDSLKPLFREMKEQHTSE